MRYCTIYTPATPRRKSFLQHTELCTMKDKDHRRRAWYAATPQPCNGLCPASLTPFTHEAVAGYGNTLRDPIIATVAFGKQTWIVYTSWKSFAQGRRPKPPPIPPPPRHT